MKLKKVINFLLALFLFLLPWQARWMYQVAFLNKTYWEYGTFSLYGTEILLWLIIILFAAGSFTRKEFWARITTREHWQKRRKYFLGSFLVIVFFATLSLTGLNPEISYHFLTYLLAGWCLGLVILASGEPKELFVWPLWLGAVGQGMLALYQFLTQHVGASKWLGLAEHFPADLGASVVQFGEERWLRAYGAFGSPNSLGIYLAVIFIFGLWLYYFVSVRQKILVLAGQLFILAGLLLSFSRAGWLAALAGLIIFAVIVFEEKNQGRGLWRQFLAIGVVLVLFLAALAPLFAARFNMSNRLEAKSIQERLTQYSESGQIFLEHPLLGVGPGTYTLELFARHPGLAAWDYQPVHSVYLLILAEAGLLGLALFVWLVVYLIRQIYRQQILCLPVLAALLVAGLFDHWLWSMYTGLVFFWAVIAVCLAKKSGEEQVIQSLPTVHQQ